MTSDLDFDRSRQLDSWLQDNQERILEFSTQAVKQLGNSRYSTLPSDEIKKIAGDNLPLGGYRTVDCRDYAPLVTTAIEEGATVNDLVGLSNTFYQGLEMLARNDCRLEEPQREFFSNRIKYVSSMVASRLTTTYLRCLVGLSLNRQPVAAVVG
jgi:hypothetical protein